MKTLTKEEILDKICKENMSNIHNMKPTKEMVLQAMQSYSDQENARLTAINEKQAELIVYLKAVTISHCPNKEDENRIISELSALKDESDSDNCTHRDPCQGRDKCLASQVISDKCIGVDCGHFEDKSLKAGEKEEKKFCECDPPYFPTGDIHFCSKCNRQTVY